jgi:hypothetical protein
VSLVPVLRSPTAPYLVTGALKEAASKPVEDKVHCTALHCTALCPERGGKLQRKSPPASRLSAGSSGP